MGSRLSTPRLHVEESCTGPILKLYSKHFETDMQSDDNLYLEGYGDEELSSNNFSPNYSIEERGAENEIDEDYPIQSFSPNMNILAPNSPNTDTSVEPLPEDSVHFDHNRSMMMAALTGKYPEIPWRKSSCEEYKNSIYDCYDKNDIDTCHEYVQDYSRCTKRQIEDVCG